MQTGTQTRTLPQPPTRTPAGSWLQRLTTERALLIILFALVFALAARIPIDTDVGWHLRSGETTLTSGFIYTDPFSYTRAGQPWVNHSWGAQVILYALWRVGGLLGLTVYMAGLAALGMFFVERTARLLGAENAYVRAFAIVLGAAAAAVFWSPRPQMLSFALSAAVLYLLIGYRAGRFRRAIWLLPVIMGVWGNLHAGFSIGFIFMAALIGGEGIARLFGAREALSWRDILRLIGIGLLSVAALVVNPYGLNMLLVPFQTVSIGALQSFIQEWNSPDFHERQTWPFIALLLGTLGVVGASGRRLGWTEFLLVAGTAFMGLLAGRNIAVFAVATTPVFAAYADAALRARGWNFTPARRATPRTARLNAVLVGVIVLVAALKTVLILEPRTLQAATDAILPARALTAYRELNAPPNLFNSYNWGGYLIWELPGERVFVDGRTDLYGDAFLTGDYLATATGQPGWRETLAEYGVNTVFVETGSGLARALREEAGWQLRYEDEQAIIFTRETLVSGEAS